MTRFLRIFRLVEIAVSFVVGISTFSFVYKRLKARRRG